MHFDFKPEEIIVPSVFALLTGASFMRWMNKDNRSCSYGEAISSGLVFVFSALTTPYAAAAGFTASTAFKHILGTISTPDVEYAKAAALGAVMIGMNFGKDISYYKSATCGIIAALAVGAAAQYAGIER